MSGILNMLLGAGDRIALVDSLISHANTGGSTATYRIDSDGFVYGTGGGGSVIQLYQWCFPAAAAINYDVRWNTTANVVDSTPGAENTNLNLGTDRTWSETNNAGFETCSFQARIHRAGNTTNVLATANVTLEADGS